MGVRVGCRWNPAIEQQAFDRLHRLGQTKPVYIHRYVAAHPAEERVLRLQRSKASMAANLLARGRRATGAAAASKLSMLDLIRLVQ